MEQYNREKYLLIVAGGSGTRMGAPVPKQFLQLGGKAVLHLTIERFHRALPDVKVVTVLPSAHILQWKNYCLEKNMVVPQKVLPGGLTRFHSVQNGLDAIPDGVIVAIHDGVRPLVSEELIRSMFEKASDTPALVPVLPCTDTMKALRPAGNGSLSSGQESFEEIPGVSVDRSILFSAQTPQIFHSEVLRKAYRQAYRQSFTDDASVAAASGVSVCYIPGERTNIKITTKEDLRLAEALMNLQP